MTRANDKNDTKQTDALRAPGSDKISKRTRSKAREHMSKKTSPAEAKPDCARIIIPTNIFQSMQNSLFSRNEERYLSTLTEKDRTSIVKQITQMSKSSKVPVRFRVLKSNLNNKEDILHRLANCSDSPKFDMWIESLLVMPFSKLAPPPVQEKSELKQFLVDTRHKMDACVYGQEEAKDEVMRLLCQWSNTGSLNSFAIALEGPPGIGKTTFAKNVIAKVMNRPFNFICLGGANDSAFLLGHSYTYEGAIPGRIVECIRTSKVMNPCFYFDELDKISKTSKGDEITNALIHLTDREQNSQFHDKYYSGVDFDISQSLFVFSYNNPNDVSPILLDRLNVIKIKPPTEHEKVQIAKLHLLPKAMKATGLTGNDILFTDDILKYMIAKYTNESGVRNLEKIIGRIVSTLGVIIYAPNVLKSIDIDNATLPVHCNEKIIDEILRSVNSKEDRHMLMYS